VSVRAAPEVIQVRRVHRRDLNRTWDFLKLVFRDVNRNTLEYQRPRTKHRFLEVYDGEETDQLLFVVADKVGAPDKIVGYAECSYSTAGADNWMNPRYFEKRGMRPLFVDELAVHPHYQGKGVGGFMLEQLQHLGRSHGCTHLVLEVAQNNKDALKWYHKRNFYRLDAAIFLAQKVPTEPELLPPRPLTPKPDRLGGARSAGGEPSSPEKPGSAAKSAKGAPAASPDKAAARGAKRGSAGAKARAATARAPTSSKKPPRPKVVKKRATT
jgi:ribosomal protein S18 acetylase RimI-like enzyme